MHIITIVITNIRSLRIYSNIRLTFEYTEYSNIRPTPNADRCVMRDNLNIQYTLSSVNAYTCIQRVCSGSA